MRSHGWAQMWQRLFHVFNCIDRHKIKRQFSPFSSVDFIAKDVGEVEAEVQCITIDWLNRK